MVSEEKKYIRLILDFKKPLSCLLIFIRAHNLNTVDEEWKLPKESVTYYLNGALKRSLGEGETFKLENWIPKTFSHSSKLLFWPIIQPVRTRMPRIASLPHHPTFCPSRSGVSNSNWGCRKKKPYGPHSLSFKQNFKRNYVLEIVV